MAGTIQTDGVASLATPKLISNEFQLLRSVRHRSKKTRQHTRLAQRQINKYEQH